MSLVHCRACQHRVDTSAEACPSCGATDPAKTTSRQQRRLISHIIQGLLWFFIFLFGGIYVYKEVMPKIKPYLEKPASRYQESNE